MIVKVPEKLVSNYLSSVSLDTFVYGRNRYVEDAVSLCIHNIV